MRWLTSDHHFGHANILKYCAATRPFSSLEEMHVGLIAAWNETVAPDDDVIVVGDFIATRRMPDELALGIMGMLQGRKILVRGNHDPAPRIFLKGGFTDVVDRIWMPAEQVLIIHRPPDRRYAPAEAAVARDLDPRLIVHGHDHRAGTPDNRGCLNVCVDRWALRPVSWTQVEKQLTGAVPWCIHEGAQEAPQDEHDGKEIATNG
jgi:calcineurin-like phosphoesterase family protein